MGKRSFTLVEILIVLVIVSILASLTITNYQKTVDAQRDKVCQQNLKVLQAAIDIYTLENSALPVSLGQLTPGQIHLAYQKVLGVQKENALLCLLKDIFCLKPAFATPSGKSFRKYYGGERKVFLCPADPGYKAKLNNINTTTLSINDISYNKVGFSSTDESSLLVLGKLKKDTTTTILFGDTNTWHKSIQGGLPYHGNRVSTAGTIDQINGNSPSYPGVPPG